MKTQLLTPTKDIRLLFTPENRALERKGMKTETRRTMNPPPDPTAAKLIYSHGYEWVATSNSGKVGIFTPTHHRSRYGCPQRTPVRYYLAEPVQVFAIGTAQDEDGKTFGCHVRYLDDDSEALVLITPEDRDRLRARKDWRKPSTAMFMLKSFARTWMKGIRVWPERLGDMADESAISEGIKTEYLGFNLLRDEIDEDFKRLIFQRWYSYTAKTVFADYGGNAAKLSFKSLWESINGPDSWDAELWVWAVKFELAKS